MHACAAARIGFSKSAWAPPSTMRSVECAIVDVSVVARTRTGMWSHMNLGGFSLMRSRRRSRLAYARMAQIGWTCVMSCDKFVEPLITYPYC